jgi:hypothetical protein
MRRRRTPDSKSGLGRVQPLEDRDSPAPGPTAVTRQGPGMAGCAVPISTSSNGELPGIPRFPVFLVHEKRSGRIEAVGAAR